MIKNLRIETTRLLIRPYRPSDLEQSFQLMQNKELFIYLHMDVMSFEEYQGLFNWLISSYDTDLEDDFKYSFAIFLKDSNTMIGWCGVGGLEFHNADKEIYYLIGRDHWKKGYASEAVTGLLDYCFDQMELPRLVAKVDDRNIASKKIIEKMGFQLDHVITGLPEEFSHCNGELYYCLDNPNRG